jgi:hypothetical protein
VAEKTSETAAISHARLPVARARDRGDSTSGDAGGSGAGTGDAGERDDDGESDDDVEEGDGPRVTVCPSVLGRDAE